MKTAIASPYFILFLIWFVATALNVCKAFHIDDAFHLEVAQWIQSNPGKPMSGNINWSWTTEPLKQSNQPPLYFYLIAGIGAVFGYTEVPLHLMQSIFSLLCVVYAYKLFRLFNSQFALAGTALLILGPAFLVNQNLSTDIPILAVSIIFIYLLIKPANVKKSTQNIYMAALLLGIGVLIKYTLLPLVVILLIRIWQERERRVVLIPAFLIPISILALWSLFNYYEFGGVHLLNRNPGELTVDRLYKHTIAFIITLGAISLFTPVLAGNFIKKENYTVQVIAILSLLLTTGLLYLTIFGSTVTSWPFFIVWILFCINGLFLIFAIALLIQRLSISKNIVIIVFWGLGMAGFIILFAPFIATRHLLLLLPALLVLAGLFYQQVTHYLKSLSLIATCFVGLALGISDWHYADFYRKAAPLAMQHIPPQTTVWTVGHWGWQWYSKQAGMQHLDSLDSHISKGDYIAVPKFISRRHLPNELNLTVVQTIPYENNLWNTFSTAGHARFYNSYAHTTPWFMALAPVDWVTVYRVDN